MGDCDDAVAQAYAAGERDALAKLQRLANSSGPSARFVFEMLLQRYNGKSWREIAASRSRIG